MDRVERLTNLLALLLETARPLTLVEIAGEMGGADKATLDQIRATYGLDRPLLEQYTTYVGRALRGDLGQSYLYNQPVTTLILQRLPATVLLVLHELGPLEPLIDRAVVLRDGRVVHDGPPEGAGSDHDHVHPHAPHEPSDPIRTGLPL